MFLNYKFIMLIYTFRFLKKETIKKIVFILICIFLFDNVFFPAPIFASDVNNSKEFINLIANFGLKNDYSKLSFPNTLPEGADSKILRSAYYTITAYNSEVAQCDSTPCITANGFNVCEHGIEDTIAANFLRFGTKVQIPELFGDRVFVVRDRMNKRYTSRVDVWMIEKTEARELGVKYAQVDILK